MVRQILPDALQLANNLDSKGTKMIAVPDARKLQQLGRIYSASR
jgi:hypothetical protein